jgi:hypothetical protein
MATDIAQQPKNSPAKYESYVEQQLTRAGGRIRSVDLLTAGLVLAGGLLAYALVMALADRALSLSTPIRLAALCGFVLGVLGFLAYHALRFLGRKVNPYFVARQLEQTLPDAKNSVINWLDLRAQSLPPVIRGAVGRRAAKDLTEADVERVVSTRRLAWVAGITASLFLAALIWCLSDSQFLPLLQRAFVPFDARAIPTHTTIELLKPKDGDVTVPLRSDVQFRVHLSGRVPGPNQPDSLKLLYRYQTTDPYLIRPFDEDVEGEWTTTILADQVRNGFWYKITAGDAETTEHQVKVKVDAQVTRFEVKYHYRPYLAKADAFVNFGPGEVLSRPDLREQRGTEVTLTTRTNRVWDKGSLIMTFGAEQKELTGDPVDGDPEARRFKLILDRSGAYQIQFAAKDGEANVDRPPQTTPYTIDVQYDDPPKVELTKPGKDIQLPANGTLSVEGAAIDDHGVKNLTLRMRAVKGPVLRPKVYRADKSFRLVNGTYPNELKYKDFVALETLKNEQGEPFALSPGMEIEYWLEATDNCDYPDPSGNVGRGKSYRVTIVAPEKNDEKIKQERKQIQKEQQKHEQQQDADQDKRNDEAAQANANDSNEPQRQADEKRRQEEFKKQHDKVNQAIEDQQKRDNKDNKEGEVKPDPSNASKGDSKDKGPGQSGTQAGDKKDQKPGKSDDASQPKSDGSNGEQGTQGAARDAGTQPKQAEQSPGGVKDNKQQPNAGPEGTVKKDQGAQGNNGASEPREGGADQTKDQAGAAKDQPKDNAATGKTKDGASAGNDAGAKADKKPAAGPGDKTETAKAKGDGTDKSGQPGPPQGANGKEKPGPTEQVAQSKNQGAGDPKSDLSKAKDAGQAQASNKETKQGEVRGQGTADNKATAKDADPKNGTQSAAKAKDGGPNAPNAPPRAENKQTPPEHAKDAGIVKNDQKTQPLDREPTLDEIAKLKDQLKQPAQRDQAARDLAQASKEAKDEKVRKAAEAALKDFKQDQRTDTARAKTDNGSSPNAVKSDTKTQGQPDKKGQPPATSQAKTGDTKGDNGATKGSGDSAKNEAITKAEPKDDGTGVTGGSPKQSTGSHQIDPKGDAASAEHARRAGDLQLESLKKKLTPDVLKQLKWTDEDLRRFLADARAYQDQLRRQSQADAKQKQTQPGGRSPLLPSVGLKKVDGTSNPVDPLNLNRPAPPPEFREAVERFSGRPDVTPPEKK